MSIQLCRLCHSEQLNVVIDLGSQHLTSRFPLLSENNVPQSQVTLLKCDSCHLVQLKDTVSASEMYEDLYGYRSGISNTMREHLRSYNQQIQNKIKLEENDNVLDIGCNDGTFLRNYPDNVRKYGIDPTAKQFSKYHDSLFIIPNYFTYDNLYSVIDKKLKFKVISSISMFYDLPDPVQFAKDICQSLDDNGIWTLEQSYILTMLERNSFDTICHEHLEYYGLKQIQDIMNRAVLKIIHIEFNDCNGGSFRIYVTKRSNSNFNECSELIESILKRESGYGLDKIETYSEFMKRCDVEVSKLNLLIDTIHKNNQRIYVYGASTKGNTLLQYAKITNQKIPFAVERNLDKVGRKTPGTDIEIISEETMRQNPPEYLLVLPWHFRDEIVEREKKYLEDGGKLVFPLPNFEIVSSKKNILITGIDGQIGSELKKNI